MCIHDDDDDDGDACYYIGISSAWQEVNRDVCGCAWQEVKLTAMVPIELPVLGNLACRLLVKVLVRVAGVN